MTRSMAAQKDCTLDPDNDLQKVEYGLTANVGEIGKVAVAYVDDLYFKFHPAFNVGGTWRFKYYLAAAEIYVSGLTVYAGTKKVIRYEPAMRI